jgi:hypothetical protein
MLNRPILVVICGFREVEIDQNHKKALEEHEMSVM